jgi:hypothetical protein
VHLILMPVFTFGIVAVDPTTVIVLPDSFAIFVAREFVATLTTNFFVAPQPAAAKPRTASSASARTGFTESCHTTQRHERQAQAAGQPTRRPQSSHMTAYFFTPAGVTAI